MMKFLLWFVYGLSHEIKQQQDEIASNARDIEAVKPIMNEAVRRTDDVYYQLRSTVKKGQRRVARVELALLNDINDGLRGHRDG